MKRTVIASGRPDGRHPGQTKSVKAAISSRQSPASAIGLSLTSWALFASSGPVAGAVMEAGWSPAAVTTIRITLAAVIVMPVVALLRPRALRFAPHDIWLLLGYGLLGVAGVQLFFFLAVSRIPVGVAMVLTNLAPVLVAVWTRVVGRVRLPIRVWVGILVALVGLALVVEIWTGNSLDLLGILAGIATAVCSAGYFLLGQHGARKHDPLGFTAVGLAIGALLVWIAAPPWTLPFDRLNANTAFNHAGVPVWLALLTLAVVSTTLPYVLGIRALRHLPATLASVLAVIEPLVAAALAWLLLGQSLGWPQLAGGAILVGGALLVQLGITQTITPEPLPTGQETAPPR